MKYGLTASPEKPLLISASLPRSPLDSTPYDLKADGCLAVDLWKYKNSGKKAFLLPNGTVQLHHSVRHEHLYAVVCKKTGWNYLTKDYVPKRTEGDLARKEAIASGQTEKWRRWRPRTGM